MMKNAPIAAAILAFTSRAMAAPVTSHSNVAAREAVPPPEMLVDLGLDVELDNTEKRDAGILDVIANLDGKPDEKRQVVPDADGGWGIDLLETIANLDGKPGSKRGILDVIANLDGKPDEKRQVVPDADGGWGIDLLETIANLDGKPGSKRGILDVIANLDGKPDE